jgi:hypothetical protein
VVAIKLEMTVVCSVAEPDRGPEQQGPAVTLIISLSETGDGAGDDAGDRAGGGAGTASKYIFFLNFALQYSI